MHPLSEKALEARDASLASVKATFAALPAGDAIPRNPSVLADAYLTPEELAITGMDAEALVPAMQSKRLSVVAVLKAFMRRAYLAQLGTNCLTEALFDTALERAQALEQHPDPAALPLYGLPLSVKEIAGIKGKVLAAGFVSWLAHDPQPDDAGVVKAMVQAGAIPFVRSTEPQFLMHLECASTTYGTTYCAFNRGLSSGGSSGGEGALVGFRGSVLGIGSDIGGSIRGPAAYNGAYGMRPTTHQVPLDGMDAGHYLQLGIAPTAGPLSTSMKGLDMFMQAIQAYDAPSRSAEGVVPLVWSPIEEVQLPRKIRVGVMYDDGCVRPHPPVQRAIRLVEQALTGDEWEVVPFDAWEHRRAWDLASSIYFPDGGEVLRKHAAAGDEPLLPLTEWILSQENVRKLSLDEYTRIILDIAAYRSAYFAHWKKAGIDVLVCPVAPGASQRLGTSRWWGYTSQWNLVDYPSVVFPVCDVDASRDAKPDGYEPRNADDKYNWDNYDPALWVGAKANVQVVGAPYTDNFTLAVSAKIEKALHNASS